MKRKLYQEMATIIDAYHTCVKMNNSIWEEKHLETIKAIEDNYLPSGSGIDCGTKINIDNSNGEKIVLFVEFHHMNENGMYDGWTEHKITIKGSLMFGINMTISGKNKNNIKGYLYEVYQCALNEICTYDEHGNIIK